MQLSAEQQAAIDEQKKQCPFCQIAAGNIPAQVVYEDDKLLAILDINPASEGHILLLPKEHYPIVQVLPPDLAQHFYATISQISHRLREALLKSHSYVFIANGAAAGQQSAHFLAHIIPSDKPLSNFSLPQNNLDTTRLNQMAPILTQKLSSFLGAASPARVQSQNVPSSSDELQKLIDENPDFREMLMTNPAAVLEGIEDNPSLQPLFEGVDVFELSKKLNDENAGEVEQAVESVSNPPPSTASDRMSAEIPRAVDLSDEQLMGFLSQKPKLKELLLTDLETLKQAIPQQERLRVFFDSTSPGDVAKRIQVRSQPESLDDLTGRNFR